MYTAKFINELTSEQVDVNQLNKLTYSDIQFKEENNEIYAIFEDNEIKLTFNSEKEKLDSFFYEPIELNENGDEAYIIVRLNYLDENNHSVQEDRYFSITFKKRRR